MFKLTVISYFTAGLNNINFIKFMINYWQVKIHQFKAKIASNSCSVRKISNAEMICFKQQKMISNLAEVV
ncbi:MULTISPECIES: hypothetical protein [Psychromonas]|uniref:hypothetical protein n=1 Tax=Psychromonas TaxID=67572 RepID=UPI00041BBD15|nr:MULTISPECIES: hypothetical protein [Psychromonas]MBB1272381.1 hypothetical protein [Psychromonas sp. SR45-3]